MSLLIFSVAKSNLFAHSLSLYQPPNVYPLAVSSPGFFAYVPDIKFCFLGAVPLPLLSNVTLLVAILEDAAGPVSTLFLACTLKSYHPESIFSRYSSISNSFSYVFFSIIVITGFGVILLRVILYLSAPSTSSQFIVVPDRPNRLVLVNRTFLNHFA